MAVLAVGATIVSQAGCYDWIQVRPADLAHRTTPEFRVTTSEATTKFWEANVEIQADEMVVKSVNRPRAEFRLSEVTAVERSKLNPATTTAAAIGIGAAVLLGALVIRHMQFPGLHPEPEMVP